MTNAEILSHIDHTILKPDAKWEDIAAICAEALQYHTASACIPPYWVAAAHKAFPALNICTVIGFPLGYQHFSVKAAETALAFAQGAREIDTVINVSSLKSGDDETVLHDLKQVRSACPDAVLKVIIETCFLTEEEKIRCCKLVTEAEADYIKTSTGFGTAGAQLEDIALFRQYIGAHVKMKAAGGIRTREQMEAFLSAGCDRIGCSAAKILFDKA
ncbi:MAG: deoxyribose-phosphate aldolase [Oscillospiraceae bacterium]|nr:deoxyribose-phosphate aldolase [Oscillospiraceae bacterium]